LSLVETKSLRRTIAQNTRANQSSHPAQPKKWAYAIHSSHLLLNAASAIKGAKSSSAVATSSVTRTGMLSK
jgi:hypothetical protein